MMPLFTNWSKTRLCEMAAVAFVNLYLMILVTLSFSEESAGLKCRVDNDERTQEGFQDVVRACMNVNFLEEENNNNNNNNRGQGHRNNNNHNNNNNWQHRPQWSQGGIPRFPTKDNRDRKHEQEDDDERDNSQEEGYGRGSSHRGYRPHSRPRVRRATSRGFYNSRNNHTQQQPPPHRHGGSSLLEDIEPCVIHCIFREMKMVDNNNQPDKHSAINVMTGRLRDPELRDFIRDTIEECFQILDSENIDSKCSLSKSFALCLEQKGKQNCEDWDDEIKRPSPKQNGMNNQNKHRG